LKLQHKRVVGLQSRLLPGHVDLDGTNEEGHLSLVWQVWGPLELVGNAEQVRMLASEVNVLARVVYEVTARGFDGVFLRPPADRLAPDEDAGCREVLQDIVGVSRFELCPGVGLWEGTRLFFIARRYFGAAQV